MNVGDVIIPGVLLARNLSPDPVKHVFRWTGKDHEAAWLGYPTYLSQHILQIIDMFEHVKRNNGIKSTVTEAGKGMVLRSVDLNGFRKGDMGAQCTVGSEVGIQSHYTIRKGCQQWHNNTTATAKVEHRLIRPACLQKIGGHPDAMPEKEANQGVIVSVSTNPGLSQLGILPTFREDRAKGPNKMLPVPVELSAIHLLTLAPFRLDFLLVSTLCNSRNLQFSA